MVYIYIRQYLSKVETGFFASLESFLKTFLGYIWQIHAYFFPFIPVVILASIPFLVNMKRNRSGVIYHNKLNVKARIKLIWKEREKYRANLLIFLIITINLIVISVFNSFLDTRRMIAAIPFIFIIFSVFLFYLYKNVKVIGVFILIISICTNILHVSPYIIVEKLNISDIEHIMKPPMPYFDADSNWRNKKASLTEYLQSICKIESYPINYLEEIMNTYEDADKGMINFLSKYAEKGQKVYLIGYQYETIAFYTGLKVVNRLNPLENPLPSVYKAYPNAQMYQQLTRYPVEECDWIIERQLSTQVADNALWHDESKFQKYYIDFPDSKPWNEIWDHSFYTDRTFRGIYIYRNRMTTSEILVD